MSPSFVRAMSASETGLASRPRPVADGDVGELLLVPEESRKSQQRVQQARSILDQNVQ